MLGAGRDWVVSLEAQREFFNGLSSSMKRMHVFPAAYHALFHEKERMQVVERVRDFILERFSEFFTPQTTPQSITPDDLNQFMVHLKKKYEHDNNTIIHNMIIVAQFQKKHGRAGLTRQIDLPEKITALPEEYTDAELKAFFDACTRDEHTLFLTFPLTGFRDQEVVHLSWDDAGMLAIHVDPLTNATQGDTPQVVLAVAENMLHTDVKRGENAGRALEHDGVVRQVIAVGKADAVSTGFSSTIAVRVAHEWNRANLRAIVFVQELHSRRILAAAAIPFPAA